MKEQIIEEAATTLLWKKCPYHPPKDYGYWKDMFKEGAKWNEEIMIDFANWCRIHDKKFPNEVWTIQQLHTKYYNETYGSKGSEIKDYTKAQKNEECVNNAKIISDVTSSQTTSEKWKEYQDWLNEVPEISDEEIFYQKQVMNPYSPTKHSYNAWEKGFMDCAKWYREQLKQKI